jgi:hypothetical protein
MELHGLDLDISRRLDTLTAEQVSRRVSYAFEHELLWYGLNAVGHGVVLREAQELELDALVEKYGLEARQNNGTPKRSIIVFPKRRITDSGGLFLPKQVYCNNEGEEFDPNVILFQTDYLNKLWPPIPRLADGSLGYSTVEPWIKELATRNWVLDDLEDKGLVEGGIRFAKALWKSSVKSYHKHKEKQPEEVTFLGERLIEYYTSHLFDNL